MSTITRRKTSKMVLRRPTDHPANEHHEMEGSANREPGSLGENLESETWLNTESDFDDDEEELGNTILAESDAESIKGNEDVEENKGPSTTLFGVTGGTTYVNLNGACEIYGLDGLFALHGLHEGLRGLQIDVQGVSDGFRGMAMNVHVMSAGTHDDVDHEGRRVDHGRLRAEHERRCREHERRLTSTRSRERHIARLRRSAGPTGRGVKSSSMRRRRGFVKRKRSVRRRLVPIKNGVAQIR